MTIGTAAERPQELPLVRRNRHVIDARLAAAHESLIVELPLFVTVRAKPVAAVVVPFVREAHGDPVARKGPHFLDEAILQFALPLAMQERLDRLAAAEELRSIAPPAVQGVRQCDSRGIAAIPGILRQARLLGGGFGVERGQWRSRHVGTSRET